MSEREQSVPPVQVARTEVQLLFDGLECFPAMLSDIAGAKEQILLEMYWFASDTLGRRFADALTDAAQRGVDVRVIYDAIGSIEAQDSMFDTMREAGCEVVQFNPIAPWRRRFSVAGINRRDHRKILIIDGAVGYTGGVNLGDPWMPVTEGGQGWRDDMVRVHGLAAREMRNVFAETWNRYSTRKLPLERSPRQTRRGEVVSILANYRSGSRVSIRREYLRRIRRARTTIYITNSYFVPDRRIRRALMRAARRGVDVRVILPGKSDVAAVYYAGRRLYTPLLRNGVRIHEWMDGVLHAKSASIDGIWCTVGTYNLDHRSWRYNLEVTAAIEHEEVAGQLATRFLKDLASTRAITRQDWRRRPLVPRLLERFFFLFRKLL